LNFDILAVKITKSASDCQPPKHSPEDDVSALLLDPLLLIMSGCLVVQREVESFSISAQHSTSVANIRAYKLISYDKYHDSGSTTLIGDGRVSLFKFDISIFESSLDAIIESLVHVLRIFHSVQLVQELVFNFQVKVLAKELSAIRTSMPVENRIVGYRNLIIYHHVLNACVRVLHVRPLTNVTDYPCVVPLHQKFEGADAEGMSWAQTVALLIKQSAIHTA
jgi:hypothetical protein